MLSTLLTIVSSLVVGSHCYSVYQPPYYPVIPVYVPVINPRAGPATSPIVIELPEENEFTCPADGLFPDVNSGCKAYYNCNGGQVIYLLSRGVIAA